VARPRATPTVRLNKLNADRSAGGVLSRLRYKEYLQNSWFLGLVNQELGGIRKLSTLLGRLSKHSGAFFFISETPVVSTERPQEITARDLFEGSGLRFLGSYQAIVALKPRPQAPRPRNRRPRV
jgi:hypothetical protein